MLSSFFPKFSDALEVRLYTREDDICDEAKMAQLLGTDAYVSLHQVHGNKTVIARGPEYKTSAADGVVTDVRGLTLMLRIADCQGFVMYAPKRGVVGVLHAGWQGLLKGAIPEFFKTIKGEWGIEPRDVFVYAAPSLCQKCSEFTDPVRELPGIPERFFEGRFVDLQRIAEWQLDEVGVLREQRERHGECTRCLKEKYWSYRGMDKELNGGRNVIAVKMV